MTDSLSIGLWIVERGARPYRGPEVEYRGVGRSGALPGLDEDADLRARGRDRLLDVTNEFWDLEDTDGLHRNPEAALRLRNALQAEAFAVEVILAEVMVPTDLADFPADWIAHYD
jgi:hypothetical protein